MKQLSSRKRLAAILFSLVLPGLGQAYNGRLLKGGCLLVSFCMLPLVVARLTVDLPGSFMLPGMAVAAVAALGIYVYALVDSYQLALRNAKDYQLKSYNAFFFYGAALLAGSALMFSADAYLKAHVVEAYKIVSSSMEPAVLQGDYVLTDKTAYRKKPVGRGDIVIVVYPDDRSKVLIRKVVGLPGQRMDSSGDSSSFVPHGKVMIKGGSSAPATIIDSQSLGPVDMRDIVGKVTQIYFSRNKDGIRWNRIGKMINPVAD